MQAPHLFLLHVAFFASIPVVLAARRRPLSVPLLYAYLAVTLFIGGFLSSLYQFPLMGDVVVGPGCGSSVLTGLATPAIEAGVLLIKGAIPGRNGGLVMVRSAVKGGARA